MSILKRIWNWLKSSSNRIARKSHPDLYPIDVERIAKELRLVEEAKRYGEAGLPSTDATAISGPEAAVIQQVEKARQDYVDWGSFRLYVLNTDISRRNITKDVNRARQADQEFERKANALLMERDSIIRKLGDIARRQQEELDNFRHSHQLIREANFPSGTRSYLQYALLIFLISIEGILNAKFFAQGLDSGLLGGFLEAVIMALINVSVAFAMGKFAIPYINHRKWLFKILGIFAILIALVVMACIGMGIAHYRDSLTAENLDPAKAALDAFTAHPFQLNDFFSWALFLISLVFGVVSLFDGLFSDDLYPGYGKITRRTITAIEDYETELNDLRTLLEELKDEELEVLNETIKHAQSDVDIFQDLIHSKQMIGSRLTTALHDASNSLDALLKKFRGENEIHRKGLRRPEYFDTQPELKSINLPDFDIKLNEISLEEQRNLVENLLSEEQGIRARIQAAFTQQFDRLKPLDLNFSMNEKT